MNILAGTGTSVIESNKNKLSNSADSAGSIIRAHLRVLKLAKKPSNAEFLTIAKVAGIGILAIGIVGFLIYILMVEVPKLVIH